MPDIHPTALISSEAKIAGEVSIGPFTVIEGPVNIAAGVKIGGHAWISGRTVIGEACHIGWGSIIGADPQDLTFDPAVDSGVILGPRNTLREYVTIHRGSRSGANTVVGKENFLMTGVHLAHDVRLGDGNIFANDVLLAGHVTFGNKAFVGGAAGFHQFVNVGDLAMIQGHASVSQDVPPYCTAYGLNLIAGLNTVGLRRAGFDASDRAEVKRAFQLVFLSGKTREAALAEAAGQDWPEPARRFLDAIASPSRKGVMSP